MVEIYYLIIITLLFQTVLLTPECKDGANYCFRCHPVTKLCVKCEKDIFVPDENGGCKYSKTCIKGNNHCLECNEEGDLCQKCEEAYFPDENGGCSYTNNCVISDDGECLKCKDEYILIGKNNTYDEGLKICKSLNSEDLKNCQKIDTEKGICQECKQGFYSSTDDGKCTLTEHCYESTFGICRKCNYGYYLDIHTQKCLKQEGAFEHCRESLDGKTCDVCDEDYYFDEEHICCGTNYCAVRGDYYRCKQCINGYYLSNYGDCCTTEKNCYYGNKDLGICTACEDNYCLDYKDGKCKSNLEDNDLKYCKIADGGCTSCESGYNVGQDGKCSFSKHCSESDLGKCLVCEDKYYLGLDKRCTSVEHCIYSNQNEECQECEDKYYYSKTNKKCKLAEGKYEHCKYGYDNSNCERCKDDYYFNRTDNLCYSNREKGPFYKCAFTDYYAERCSQCIDNYYLGYIDDKCTPMEGCDLSESEDVCLECDSDYYCLDLKTRKCYPNDEIVSEEKKFYYRCNITNAEGTRCADCIEDYVLNENGLCIDLENCLSIDGNKCNQCNEDYCLNNIFGCIKLYSGHCVECNQILDFANCTKCESGYELDDYNQCRKIYNK